MFEKRKERKREAQMKAAIGSLLEVTKGAIAAGAAKGTTAEITAADTNNFQELVKTLITANYMFISIQTPAFNLTSYLPQADFTKAVVMVQQLMSGAAPPPPPDQEGVYKPESKKGGAGYG